jgi:hypothetical protein
MTTKNQLNRLKGRYLDKTFVTEIPNTLDDRDGCFRLRLTIVDIKFVKRINKVERLYDVHYVTDLYVLSPRIIVSRLRKEMRNYFAIQVRFMDIRT